MKVLILGATGGTGQELVRQALERGHEVTAFVRDPAKLKTKDERIRVVKGNILEPKSLTNAIKGQDAVISALGTGGFGKSTELSDGTANIIRIMEAEGVRRLVFETANGVGDSSDHLPWLAKKVFFPLVLKNVVADKEIQERCIRESSLEWTIVRPGKLTNGKARGKYRSGDEINSTAVSSTISRSDVAAFMLRQLDDATYLKKTPAVSY